MTLHEGMRRCLGAWKETLEHFGISKDPKLDEVQICRMIQSQGESQTELALLGARFEAKTSTFDPADYISIRRIAKPDVFDKLANLGAKEMTRRRKAVDAAQAVALARAKVEEPKAEEYTQDPERVRSILSGLLKKAP